MNYHARVNAAYDKDRLKLRDWSKEFEERGWRIRDHADIIEVRKFEYMVLEVKYFLKEIIAACRAGEKFRYFVQLEMAEQYVINLKEMCKEIISYRLDGRVEQLSMVLHDFDIERDVDYDMGEWQQLHDLLNTFVLEGRKE